MKRVAFWRVAVIADCEGKSVKTIARFTDRCEAKVFAESDAGRDMYGRPGEVLLVEFELYEAAEEAVGVAMKKMKLDAMRKLTKQEIAALGLSKDA